MSIIRAAAELIVKAHGHYKFEGPALSLGVAEVSATRDQLSDWLARYTDGGALQAGQAEDVSSNKFGAKLGWVTARGFFDALGIGRVDDLDIPGCEHPAAVIHDLNEPLPEIYHGQYKFLLDPGTLEHIFDQRQCFQTIHRALAVGGVVCHFVPIYSYNGGYYSINPNVVHDFYRNNGFGEITSYVIMWDRYRTGKNIKTRCYEYREDVLGSRHAVADFDQVRYTPHLLFFARKLEDKRDIVCPIQFDGDYVGQASMLETSREQGLERRGKKIAELAYKILPLGWAHFLQAAAYRRLVLLRARRSASFWV